jgi:F-type H+-transporting ATPase subunit epsilon
MSEGFNIDIVNPEKSFLSKKNVSEVIVPAFEGEMGILKDHIPIISFLKPGIIKVISGTEEHSFYVEDGIVEFKDNSLSILTSSIFDIKDADKKFISENITEAENELNKENLDDQKRFLLNHKVEVLKSLSIN